MSLISFLTFSSIQAFFYNVEIPNGDPEINLDLKEPENMYVKLPFKISNKGFFDIRDIEMNISVDILYTENVSYKETRKTIFLREDYKVGHCKIGQELVKLFEGSSQDFNLSALIIYKNEVDVSKSVKLLLKIELSGNLYNLISLDIRLENIILEEK